MDIGPAKAKGVIKYNDDNMEIAKCRVDMFDANLGGTNILTPL